MTMYAQSVLSTLGKLLALVGILGVIVTVLQWM